jgi:hypothetical protein
MGLIWDYRESIDESEPEPTNVELAHLDIRKLLENGEHKRKEQRSLSYA